MARVDCFDRSPVRVLSLPKLRGRRAGGGIVAEVVMTEGAEAKSVAEDVIGGSAAKVKGPTP